MKMPEGMMYADTMEFRVAPLVQQAMRQKRIAGLSLALVDDSEILWARGYGYADKEARQLATTRTVYKIASITKVFTGTAAMQLPERGLLDIDKPVSQYLPEFSIKSRAGHNKQLPFCDRRIAIYYEIQYRGWRSFQPFFSLQT